MSQLGWFLYGAGAGYAGAGVAVWVAGVSFTLAIVLGCICALLMSVAYVLAVMVVRRDTRRWLERVR